MKLFEVSYYVATPEQPHNRMAFFIVAESYNEAEKVFRDYEELSGFIHKDELTLKDFGTIQAVPNVDEVRRHGKVIQDQSELNELRKNFNKLGKQPKVLSRYV